MSTAIKTTRPPEPLARTVLASLWGVFAAELLFAFASLMELGALRQYSAEAPDLPYADLALSDMVNLLVGLGGVAYTLAYLIAGFFTLKWIYRVNLNASVLAPSKEIRPAWAVGWYFVPFAALYMPFKAMRETWQISQSPKNWRSVATPSLLRWWWGLYLFNGLLGNIGTRISFSAKTVGEVAASDQFNVASSFVSVPLVLVLMAVIRRVTEAQRQALDIDVFAEREASAPALVSG